MQHESFTHFQALVQWLNESIDRPALFSFGYNAEASDFIRFNHAQVRQAGHVTQIQANLKLIDDGRQADLQVGLSGQLDVDRQRLSDAIASLRAMLPLLPADPYLQLNSEPWQSHVVLDQALPDAHAVVERLCTAAAGLDLVGIYAAGPISRGFANAQGALGWHQANSFNLDWSLFHANGEAVKANYAGQQWHAPAFEARLASACEQLQHLGEAPKVLLPGRYRAYLAPAAVDELVGMLSWGGFSAQAIASKNSPLQRLYDGDQQFNAQVSLGEQISGSLSPSFSDEGYPRDDLMLIRQGRAAERLVDSRSASEYALQCNGASSGEYPSALDMAAGDLRQQDILQRLGTGLYISNLWYLNYSDLPAARLTGLTRFATFWVQDGRIQAPVSTMRFDDSVYSLLGEQLEALTVEREMILSTSSYSERRTSSSHLPGALVKAITLTL